MACGCGWTAISSLISGKCKARLLIAPANSFRPDLTRCRWLTLRTRSTPSPSCGGRLGTAHPILFLHTILCPILLHSVRRPNLLRMAAGWDSTMLTRTCLDRQRWPAPTPSSALIGDLGHRPPACQSTTSQCAGRVTCISRLVPTTSSPSTTTACACG